jgi:hypothetical protein
VKVLAEIASLPVDTSVFGGDIRIGSLGRTPAWGHGSLGQGPSSSVRRREMSTLTAALETVSQIDLSPINQVLQHENPAFWTDEVIAETEANYRRLLALNVLYPSETLVVNKILDDYWHQHILDTRKYAADCQKIFGFFLHHYPYFGINGEDDRQKNREAFAVTRQLWEETFGFPMVRETKLTLDKVLGTYDPERKHADRNRVYAFPQTCKCGQHCDRTIVPDPRINPQINPQVNPQINPQVRPPLRPQLEPSIGR